MLFSSVSFIYIFLPLTLLLYYITPKAYKNYTLLVLSLGFYFCGEPIYVSLLVFSSISDYIHSIIIEKNRTNKIAKRALISSIIINVLLLSIFKYLDFFISGINLISGLNIPLLHIPLPIGISFFTFQTMSYTIDVYRGNVKVEKNFFTLATYVCLFPQLVAGPIVRYIDVNDKLKERSTTLDYYYLGTKKFVVGLGQKVIIANALGEFVAIFKDSSNKSILFFWAYAIAFSLQIYFDFAGYSNMAIGLGKMFGFDFPENFNYPYISKSIKEFWRRWHITLGKWFRDYLYIPLGGSRKGVVKHISNLIIVWAVTGLWHGASLNFLLWGIYFALLMIVEIFVFGDSFNKIPSVIRHIYVVIASVLSFVIFDSENLSELVLNFKGIFGILDLPFSNFETMYYLSSYLLLFIVAIIGATPIMKKLYFLMRQGHYSKYLIYLLEPFTMAILLIVSTAYIIGGSFNPFLYFRF